ncbi:hypothetical protein [Actinokineospora pegani]|uniref:hypothetical protein n=1 Tax=Actinokineospora pegani TaxID=2654637 RepID=UPI0012E9D1AB|nr:hypothetical protein [Actinokineospora pegani]
MEMASTWRAKHEMLTAKAPRRNPWRATAGLSIAALIVLSFSAFMLTSGVSTGLDGGWDDRVCRSSGRGCGPAWLSATVGVFILAGGLGLLVAAARERGKREWSFALEPHELRVVLRDSPALGPHWVSVRWSDVEDVLVVSGRLNLELKPGAVATTLDGAETTALRDLFCGDAHRDAAVLRHFLHGDKQRIGTTWSQDEATRVSREAADTP